MLKQSQQFNNPSGKADIPPIGGGKAEGSEPEGLEAEIVPWMLHHGPVWVIRFRGKNEKPLSWASIAHGLTQSAEVRSRWNQTWAEIPADFMWKPVPIHPDFANSQPFFAVAVPTSFPPANATAYQSHLQRLAPEESVAVFPNLSGQSQLVVPQNTGAYGHIRAFCRTAPSIQWNALWQQVGAMARQAIQQQQVVWCNTHGHGVPWMHIRFDPTHKYAAFPPYGTITSHSQQQWYDQIYQLAYPSN